jgi:hypothetical protein
MRTTYVLNAIVGVIRRQQEGADRGHVQVVLAVVLEANQQLDALTGNECCAE